MQNTDMEYTDGPTEKNTAGNIIRINERVRESTDGISAINIMVHF